jgi:hypothetical protein
MPSLSGLKSPCLGIFTARHSVNIQEDLNLMLIKPGHYIRTVIIDCSRAVLHGVS